MEKTCKCNGTGCKCATTKSPTKTFNRPAAMYKNDNGTSYSLSYIASQVGKHFGSVFGAFNIGEENGKLIIHTDMKRDGHLEALISEHCKQPCSGECEATKCSTREIAGL